jgi:hypothetical protein
MQSGVSRPVSAAASGKLYTGSGSGLLYGGSSSGVLDFSESQPKKKLYEVKNLGVCVCTCIQRSIMQPKKKLYAVKSIFEIEEYNRLVVWILNPKP